MASFDFGMTPLLVSVFLGALAFAPKVTASAESPAGIAELCDAGIEGSYLGRVGSLHDRTNIICTGDGRLVTVLGEDETASSGFQNLAYAEIEGDELVLSSFPLKNEDRRSISSKASMNYMKLRLPDLRQGHLRGIFHGGNLDHSVVVDQTRSKSFPHWECNPRANIPVSVLKGSFRFADPKLGEITIYGDVLAGTPIFTIVIPGQRGFQTMDGPAWDGSGCFESFTSEGDGEADARALNYLRGRWHEGELEIAWVNFHGLEGPLRAQTPKRTFVGKK